MDVAGLPSAGVAESAASTHGMGKAIAWTLSSSILVPLAGLATAPILARGLGADGRGAVTASLAPAALITSAANLGLTDSLTYFTARYASGIKRFLPRVAFIALIANAICSWVAIGLAGKLAAGDNSLQTMIQLATVVSMPIVLVSVARSVATGLQLWRTTALERLINCSLKIFVFALLLSVGVLGARNAILASCVVPLIAGLCYVRLLRPRTWQAITPVETGDLSFRRFLRYGFSAWIGSVASMVLARLTQVIFVPLSNVTQLGYFTVATTIADVPIVVAFGVHDAVFGVSSRSADAHKVAQVTRITTLLGMIGCAVVAVTLPWWIGFVFGDDFTPATLPTQLLLVGSAICVPGMLAGAGLSAWGKPGLRSTGLAVAVVGNIVLILLLVPRYGAIGAGLASIGANLLLTFINFLIAAAVMHIPVTSFLRFTRADASALRGVCVRLIGRIQHVPRTGATR